MPRDVPDLPQDDGLSFAGRAVDDGLFFSRREDFQVKIDGVRIELGEIEAAAQQGPGVFQAKALVAERDDVRSLALLAAVPARTPAS